MRDKDEDGLSPEELDYITQRSPKKSRISYTREFLISLSELDICKRLPKGFDPAILSDFGDSSSNVPERPRVPGILSSQHFRRGEFGSSPPTRGDSASYSRGTQGRWDTRSSGSNDRDADTQLDPESDSGRRYGNHPRRSWQNTEHDGLLGSGAFPRPSGPGTGASSAKVRGNGYQLSRSNEPYHPPRPYKAVPHSRREDSINDETFGSSEVSSEDRAEEERKRRASFEQFRKEQKELNEKQKQFPDKRKESTDPDITALLADSENDKKLWDRRNESEEVVQTVSQNDSSKSSFPTQTPASRPLVPPGFRSTVLEKSHGTKSSTHSALEVRHIGSDSNIESNLADDRSSDRQGDKKSESLSDSSQTQYETLANPVLFTDISERLMTRSSDIKKPGSSVDVVSPPQGVLNLSEAYQSQTGTGFTNVDAQKVPRHDLMGTGGQEPTSILEKLFGKAPAVNIGASSLIEDGDVKVEAAGNNIASKFTHWFLEEEKSPTDGLASGKPTDLLSLIGGGEKGVSQLSRVSDEKESILPVKGEELLDRLIMPSTASAIGTTSEPLYHSKAPNATVGVLTCEDLEQSILSEISEKNVLVHHPELLKSSSSDAKPEHAKAEVNNHASLHLLSLLKKEAIMTDLVPSSNLAALPENLVDYESTTVHSVLDKSSEGSGGNVKDAGTTLTLETLFGSSFMNALHSVDAPVSVHRGSISGATRSDVPPDSQGFPFRVADDSYLSDNTIFKDDIHVSNRIQQAKSNKTQEQWVGYDTHSKLEPDLTTVGASTTGRKEELEIQLPEEESLFTMGDPVISQHSMVMPIPDGAKVDSISFASTPVDIADKLASLKATLRSERSNMPNIDGVPLHRGPYDPPESEIPFQNLQDQFAQLQMTHGRPSFQHLDSHHTQMNPQLKFMGQEHPELAPHHRFPANVFRPPTYQAGPGGPVRYDLPQHPMLQQMHIQGNLHPSHLQQGLPRGPHMLPFPVNHMPGYVSEMNHMQGFPFGHNSQHSYGGHEMPMPGPGVSGGGSNHPEALEKLFEMELRANLKQMPPPVAGAAQGFGPHSHGIDMGFRYR